MHCCPVFGMFVQCSVRCSTLVLRVTLAQYLRRVKEYMHVFCSSYGNLYYVSDLLSPYGACSVSL